MAMMKRALRDLWAVTLESGNYKQCQGVLRNSKNQTCCLGVLADIYRPSGWADDTRPVHTQTYKPGGGVIDHYVEAYGYHGQGRMVPTQDLMDMGLDHTTASQFAGYNDTVKMTFKQIARKVRKLPVID